ncbi:MAG TPA: electron transfer flavoprotein subunit beta/FixA family protein [Ktedonobacterales bacterium]|nr:electron transfer flavoprotein subunit beta/FixA family protein [Ktedonobacterales bacterium]
MLLHDCHAPREQPVTALALAVQAAPDALKFIDDRRVCVKICVCVKQIPDPNTTTPKLDPATNRLVRTGVSLVLDPGDEGGVEAALLLQEKHGGEVVAVSMGPQSAQEAVRRTLAMGVDRAILISDPALAGSDSLGTARALAAAIKAEAPDLVICATESTDGYTGMVPGGIAELLGVPALSFAREIEINGDTCTVHRVTPTGYQVVEAALPVVVTVASGAYTPRYPSMKGIMASKKKPLDVKGVADLGLSADDVGDAGAKERVVSVGRAEARAAGRVIKDDGTGAAAIADFLAQNKLV